MLKVVVLPISRHEIKQLPTEISWRQRSHLRMPGPCHCETDACDCTFTGGGIGKNSLDSLALFTLESLSSDSLSKKFRPGFMPGHTDHAIGLGLWCKPRRGRPLSVGKTPAITAKRTLAAVGTLHALPWQPTNWQTKPNFELTNLTNCQT